MKRILFLLIGITIMALFISCEKWFNKDEDPGVLGGDQSPMGEVGVTVSSSSAVNEGVSGFQATVIALDDGVSSYSGSATVTNQIIKELFTKIPGITANGNTITGKDIKLRQTKEGIELLSGPSAGILFKYGSEVGDSYPIGSTGKVRTVVSKTGQDDYNYGFMLIKTIQVEETSNKLKSTGISKITYVGNHRFGLVGFKVSLNDGTSVNFPVYTSTENK